MPLFTLQIRSIQYFIFSSPPYVLIYIKKVKNETQLSQIPTCKKLYIKYLLIYNKMHITFKI